MPKLVLIEFLFCNRLFVPLTLFFLFDFLLEPVLFLLVSVLMGVHVRHHLLHESIMVEVVIIVFFLLLVLTTTLTASSKDIIGLFVV